MFNKLGGCLRRGVVIFLGCAVFFWVMSFFLPEDIADDDSGEVRSTLVVIASITPDAVVSDTVVPTATITSTLLPSDTPAPVASDTPLPSPIATEVSLEQLGLQMEIIIRDVTDVDIFNVQIADGRVNGGERVVIIAFATLPDRIVNDVANLAGTVLGAMRSAEVEFDAISLIFGSNAQNTEGIATIQYDDLIALETGSITVDEFFERIEIVDLTE